MDLNTSLLREKFTIKEQANSSGTSTLDIIAPSTRFPLDLTYANLPSEQYIIRTNNMHNCVRAAANLIDNYEHHGPIQRRATPIEWSDIWGAAFSPYERIYSTKAWISIYHEGEVIFSHGKHHPFFDVIEKCDALNKGDSDYVNSIKLAKTAFSQAGKEVDIEYETNIALVAYLSKLENRCSMVLRWADRTTTFNYSMSPITDKIKFAPIQSLITASYFLEGVQLSFLIGKNTALIKKGTIAKHSEKYTQTKKAKERLTELQMQINSVERSYKFRYRPERPDFDYIMHHAEKFISETL